MGAVAITVDDMDEKSSSSTSTSSSTSASASASSSASSYGKAPSPKKERHRRGRCESIRRSMISDPLLIACQTGDVYGLSDLLVQVPPEALRRRYKGVVKYHAGDATLVHVAVANGHLRVVRVLVEQCGLDPSATMSVDRSTCLMLAAEFDQGEVMQYLLEECGIRATIDHHNTINGRTALHYAAINKSLPCVMHLLRHHACAVERDRDGLLPVDYCDYTREADEVAIALYETIRTSTSRKRVVTRKE